MNKFAIDFIGFIGLYICLLLGRVVVVYEQVLVKAACTFSSDSNQKQTFPVYCFCFQVNCWPALIFVLSLILIFFFWTKEDVMFKLA